MELVEIGKDGIPARPIDGLTETVSAVLKGTAEMYRTNGFQRPWIGYLAIDESRCVGTCAFKSPPAAGRVEIAYFTFPDYEGRGIATSMAKSLVEMANSESPGVRIYAQTLPEHNASTRVLKKLGFHQIGEIDHTEDGRVWEWELLGPHVPQVKGQTPR